MLSNTNHDLQLLNKIKNGCDDSLKEVYLTNKSKFLKNAKRWLNDDDVLEDIYQDAIIIFYENVRNEKIIHLTSSINTYITSIGKYLILRHFRSVKQTVEIESIHQIEIDQVFISYIHQVQEESEKVNMIKKMIQNLGEPCASILRMFYYEEKSTIEIMKSLGYANSDVVKSQKYRCMKSLKFLVNKKYSDVTEI